MIRSKTLIKALLSVLIFEGIFTTASAEDSVDSIAKEASNPAGSLALFHTNIQYQDFSGNLNNADKQNSTTVLLQPALPFPVGDEGNRVIFRPLIPIPLDQPVFDPSKDDFSDADTALGDITFDLVYAGTKMKNKNDGYLWGVGLAGTLPTASEDDLQGDQWRFGPEIFTGIIKEWGLVGALVSHQWDTGGSNDNTYSTTAAQYFYAYGLGNGWQISASPVATYDWEAKSNDKLSLPLGVGIAKTTKLGGKPWKFQFQVHKYVVQPDTFSPDWLVKLTITPIIQNPFILR